jgi:hypothetical protein
MSFAGRPEAAFGATPAAPSSRAWPAGNWDTGPDRPPPHPLTGRHVARSRPGLRWVLAWTLAGTVVPGAGLLAAGHRRAGGVLIATGVLTPVTVGGALWRRSMDGGLATLDEDPNALAFGAGLAIGTGVLLAGVALVTNRALLRRSRPGRRRRAADMILAGALIGALLAGGWVSGSALLERRADVATTAP